MSETKSGLSAQLFIGCAIGSELRMHLNHSTAWKQKKLVESGSHALREIHHQDKDFLGFLVNQEKLSIEGIRELELSLQKAISDACPDLDSSGLKTYIFPQLFLS